MRPELANLYKEMYAMRLHLPLGAHFFVRVVTTVMIYRNSSYDKFDSLIYQRSCI